MLSFLELAGRATTLAFDRKIMSNDARGRYVEMAIAAHLGEPYALVGGEWSGWDIEKRGRCLRIQVKQSAALQPWTGRITAKGNVKPGAGVFDVSPATGFFDEFGLRKAKVPGRHAEIHIFAWHPETDEKAVDQRDLGQWRFYVVPTASLGTRKRIAIEELESGLATKAANMAALHAILEEMDTAVLPKPTPLAAMEPARRQVLEAHYALYAGRYVAVKSPLSPSMMSLEEWYRRRCQLAARIAAETGGEVDLDEGLLSPKNREVLRVGQEQLERYDDALRELALTPPVKKN
jgi:hypothetical protein